MPGDGSISFKAYIMRGHEHTEVRRFEVDQGVVTNFDYIRERLQYIFPNLRGKTFKILWRDSEGDEVTISSDEEMMIALSELKADLCKLFIRLPDEEPTAEFTFGIPFQMSMCPAMADMENSENCRTCQKPMQGFRYKCLECLDFYQCAECEAKGTHSDHVMLRLSQSYPSLMSMIPKGLHILRHLVKGSTKCVGKAAHEHFKRFESGRGNWEKWDKCKRKGKKHSKYERCGEKSEKCQEKCEEKFQEKCQSAQAPQESADTYVYNEIERLVRAFVNMFPSNQSSCPMKQDFSKSKDTQGLLDPEAESSQDEDMGCEILDAPAELVKISKDDSSPPESNSGSAKKTEPGALPSGSNTSPQIMQAVQLLTEMGFPNEGQWLAKILERFDGDITKALDHLTQYPK